MRQLWAEADVVPGPAPEKHGLRILVVEDNRDYAETSATLLRILGHSVELAADGVTALEVAEAGKPDVVLLDLGIPGIKGYDVARLLHKNRTGIRPLIIAISGYGPEAGTPQRGETGIDLHMVKPASTHDLHAVLTRFQDLLKSNGG